MQSESGVKRLSKPLTSSVIAAFVWATLGPVGQMTKSYGSELPAANAMQAELHGDVKADSSKQAAQAIFSGVVIGEEAPKKLKKSNPLVKILAGIGVAGGAVVAVLALSGGGGKLLGGAAPRDTVWMPNDSTHR